MPGRTEEFEWNAEKAKRKLKKHNVSFEEAEPVFGDPYARVIDDPDHSLEEAREIIIGRSHKNRLLFVSFTSRAEVIRIISARKADKSEHEAYEEEYNQDSERTPGRSAPTL